MDTSNKLNASHLENESKCEGVIYKRRSSVFQSRTVVFDKSEDIEDAVETTHPTKPVSKMLQTEGFNLEKYVISLKMEKKQWTETLKQRKKERKALERQKLDLEKNGHLLDLCVLTEDEKAFVTARPNYQQICKNYKRLLATAAKLSLLRSTVYKLNRRFIIQMEGNLHRVTEKIIETSRS